MGEQAEGLIGKPVDMASLAQYQEGSVVSRTVIARKEGTVTLFAFDKGEGLSEHTAPFDAMVCILDGTAEITVSGVKHTVKGGEMIIMPANQPHSLHAAERFKMLLVMVKTVSGVTLTKPASIGT